MSDYGYLLLASLKWDVYIFDGVEFNMQDDLCQNVIVEKWQKEAYIF